MAEKLEKTKDEIEEGPPAPALLVAPSPHLTDPSFTTQRMMIDVLIALLPLVVMSVFVFKWASVVQLGVAVVAAMAAEGIFTKMRGRPLTLHDGSAAVTGLIIGLSLPWSAPSTFQCWRASSAWELGRASSVGWASTFSTQRWLGALSSC